jgi:hypothetical protein
MGSQGAVEANQVGSGRGNEGREQPQELQGSQHQVGGAIGSRPLEAIAQAAIGAFFESFEGERTSGAIAAEQLEAVAVALVDVGVGVKGETFEGGTAALAGRWTLIGGEGKATLRAAAWSASKASLG